MFPSIKLFRIFWLSLTAALLVVVVKFVFHQLGWEIIEQSSLHNSVISSVIFVIGFLLSATITDYKESERIPSELATNIEDMYDDAAAIHTAYPVFDLKGFGQRLRAVALSFGSDARHGSVDTKQDIRDLAPYFIAMEIGKVPPNFIIKLKQQQTQLLRSRQRVSYIQRITFIPSATILARSIGAMAIGLLLITNVDPFYGGLTIVGIISFILIYILILIAVISTPFHAAGKTQDDVSLFLVSDAAAYLEKQIQKK